MKLKKPEPFECYDIHEVTEYLNKKYNFTDDDWDDVINKFVDELGNGSILTIEGEGTELEKRIIEEFDDDEDGQVDIYYWW